MTANRDLVLGSLFLMGGFVWLGWSGYLILKEGFPSCLWFQGKIVLGTFAFVILASLLKWLTAVFRIPEKSGWILASMLAALVISASLYLRAVGFHADADVTAFGSYTDNGVTLTVADPAPEPATLGVGRTGYRLRGDSRVFQPRSRSL